MSEALVRAVESSNLSYGQKSKLSHAIDMIRSGGRSGLARAGQHGLAGVQVVRKYGEAGITGAAAGAAHVMLPHGLDVVSKTGVKVPLDGLSSGLLAIVSVAAVGQPGAEDAANIGANLGGIWAFRKTYDFMAAKRKKAGGHVGGTFGNEDDDTDWQQPTLGAETEDQLLSALRQL